MILPTKVVGKQKLDVTQLLSNEFLTNGEEEMMMMVAADISRVSERGNFIISPCQGNFQNPSTIPFSYFLHFIHYPVMAVI